MVTLRTAIMWWLSHVLRQLLRPLIFFDGRDRKRLLAASLLFLADKEESEFLLPLSN